MSLESPGPKARSSRKEELNPRLAGEFLDLKSYLDAAGAEPLLSAQEEIELAKAMETGLYAEQLLALLAENTTDAAQLDEQVIRELETLALMGQEAKQRFIRANLLLVVDTAKRIGGGRLEERVQDGNLGLILAVEKFDYTRGNKFSTPATWWIFQAIIRGRDKRNGVINTPPILQQKAKALRGAQRRLLQKTGREPTDEELARELGIKPEELSKRIEDTRVVENILNTASYNAPAEDGSEHSLLDVIGGTTGVGTLIGTENDHPNEAKFLSILRTVLDREEVRLVSLAYGFDGLKLRTQKEVASQLGVHPTTVERRLRGIISKLRSEGVEDSLWESLEPTG